MRLLLLLEDGRKDKLDDIFFRQKSPWYSDKRQEYSPSIRESQEPAWVVSAWVTDGSKRHILREESGESAFQVTGMSHYCALFSDHRSVTDLRDLDLLLCSDTPILLIETLEERSALPMQAMDSPVPRSSKPWCLARRSEAE